MTDNATPCFQHDSFRSNCTDCQAMNAPVFHNATPEQAKVERDDLAWLRREMEHCRRMEYTQEAQRYERIADRLAALSTDDREPTCLRTEAIVGAAVRFCANKTEENELALSAAVMGDPLYLAMERARTKGEG